MRAIETRLVNLEKIAEAAIPPESVPSYFLPPGDGEAAQLERERMQAEIAELERLGKRVIVFSVYDASVGA